MTSTFNVCPHSSLTLVPSKHSSETGFSWSTAQKRAAAVTPQGKAPSNPSVPDNTSFPAPLVLPEDDLALDPNYPAQCFRSWIRLKERNPVTKEKRTIYVAEPPSVDPSAGAIRQWSETSGKANSTAHEPQIQEVIDYLAAFYHGIIVRKLPARLVYTRWDTGRLPSKFDGKKHGHIGLNIGTECVRIRTRVSKDLFDRQLNLDDLLDAAISLLPDDAYALLLLVSHDIYENEEDDFACGRAYGGSRVAVVSTARYNPAIDASQNINRDHSWPASHCSAYVQSCCTGDVNPPMKRQKRISTENHIALSDNGPIYAALAAHQALPSPMLSLSPNASSGLWLARICRTASHELGHCFGIDHCVYYACAMQGTASLVEDARQPPYICPVDLVKVLYACGTTKESRNQALRSFCERYKDVHHFSAFAAWLRSS
ncbi:hypothetical protein J3R30DRAFT_3700056 [Lentinula aciculospora]|uniref:Uncharacterized protein n=1 Tax=Lentinula aciculospora TaxID=153920 RepID=A0A9W9AI67_9AGAR|nr:hypothetical protein J3R30DRAFT_3700056 [Lentinula aciculospora]